MKLSDDELIAALRERFADNSRAINDLKVLTAKLESTNRRLQESEALKGHFLSNIRNEINNPLTAIMGVSAQLTGGGVDPEQMATAARIIHSEASELNSQLENIFIAAGLEAGQEAPSPARVDVAAVLAEVLQKMEHRRFEKSVILRHRCAEDLHFMTDPRFLQLMLLNLIANALEFSPQGGVVEVAVEGEEGLLRLTVRDHGPGIDPAFRETIFDRFRQLDQGSCKSHRGHGLGLSITRALVELLGGMVALDSHPDEGTTFTLSIPLLQGEPGTEAPDSNFFLFDAVERF